MKNPSSMSPKMLRERRRQLGLTQAELASRLGVSRQTVNSWERGRVRAPSWSNDQLRWMDNEQVALPRRSMGIKGLRRGPYVKINRLKTLDNAGE